MFALTACNNEFQQIEKSNGFIFVHGKSARPRKISEKYKKNCISKSKRQNVRQLNKRKYLSTKYLH